MDWREGRRLAEGRRLLVRSDGKPETGLGHLMRTLALAEAWSAEGGSVTFLCAAGAEHLVGRAGPGMDVIRLDGVEPGSVEDVRATIEAAESVSAMWVALDGYSLGPVAVGLEGPEAPRVLLFDDNGEHVGVPADLVLNQNVGASPTAPGERYPGGRVIAGPSFALLREEFLAWRDWERSISEVASRVLVIIGGTDPEGVGGVVADELAAMGIEADVAQGVSDMAALMAEIDMAVAAAGSTVYELAFMQTPAVVLQTAENQDVVVHGLRREGLYAVLGSWGDVDGADVARAVSSLLGDVTERRRQAAAGRALIDGAGGARVVAEMVGGPS